MGPLGSDLRPPTLKRTFTCTYSCMGFWPGHSGHHSWHIGVPLALLRSSPPARAPWARALRLGRIIPLLFPLLDTELGASSVDRTHPNIRSNSTALPLRCRGPRAPCGPRYTELATRRREHGNSLKRSARDLISACFLVRHGSVQVPASRGAALPSTTKTETAARIETAAAGRRSCDVVAGINNP